MKIKPFLWCLVLGLFFLVTSCNKDESAGQEIIKDGSNLRVVGYLPEYRMGAIHDDMFDYVTDIVYFSIETEANGDLILRESSIADIMRLNQMIGARDVHLFVSVGGWLRSAYFGEMALSDSARGNFVNNITDFCLTQGLDGADIDWEFPNGPDEVEAEQWLFRDLNLAFEEHGLMLTTAQASLASISEESLRWAHRVHIMSYENPGRHATFSDAVGDVRFFEMKNIEPHRLFLGVPFFGRNLADRTPYTYADIFSMYSPAPDEDEVEGIYFNNINTIRQKTRYAIDEDLGGIMIWELGQDIQGEKSLLKAIYDEKNRR